MGDQTRSVAGTVPAAAAFFDEIAHEYDSWYEAESLRGYALRARQQRALALLGNAGRRVLDVGCGPGSLAGELLQRGHDVWGVDAAPTMIELCRRRFGQRSRAHFIVGDATELKFPDCSFDAVTCLGVIEKVQAYDAAVNEMVRVLKPGGTLLIAFPNQLSPYGAWRRWIFCPAVALLRPFYFRLTGRPRTPTLYGKGARSWLSLKEFEYPHGAISLMERHGADVTGLAYYDPSLLLSPLDELFPRVAVSVTKRMERSWNEKLQWLGSGFMLKGLKV